MNSISRYVWEIGLALGLGLLGSQSIPAQEQQVVLLRNGTTLQGRVVREGDSYYVAVARGEIQLRAAQVERVCNSLEECFQYRLAHLLPGDVHGRLELAQWCVEHGLARQAAVLLDHLERICPRHPRLALLRRRLRLNQHRAEDATRPAPARPAGAISPPGVYRRHQQQAREDQALLEPLEPQAVRRFTISVHRILQNRCAAGGCHGPGAKNAFRMIRASQGRVSPRVVRHNLVEVLRWIDRRQVDRSLLLRKALTPHGSQGLYQFQGLDKHSARVLRQWLSQLEQKLQPSQEAHPPGQPGKQQPTEANQPVPKTVNARLFQQRTTAEGASSRPEPPRPGATVRSATAVVPVSRSGSATFSTSPYDPAWFNRRFHGSKRSQDRDRQAAVSRSRRGQSADKSKSNPALRNPRSPAESSRP